MNTYPRAVLAALLVAPILLAAQTASAFNVINGEVIEFTGPDDLTLDPGTAVIAVDSYGNGDSVVNGVTFFTDRAGLGAAVTGEGVVSSGGVTVTTGLVNQIDNWANAGGVVPIYTGADAASAASLAEIMRDIRWANAGVGETVSVDITGLDPETLYNIQLLVNEGGDRDRRWDIAVDGVLAVDDFSSEGEGVWTGSNGFAYAGEFNSGPDGSINIVMGSEPVPADPNNTPPAGLDNNAILQAIVVHNAAPDTAPDDILLSPSEFAAGVPIGTTVGTLTSSDVNGGTHDYELVAGAGDTDNAKFQIDGEQVETATDFSALGGMDFSIRVRSTDETDLSFEKAIVVSAAADSDLDQLEDSWELMFGTLGDFTGLANGPGPGAGTGDFDGDGSPDAGELANGTDPTDPDSDDDGSSDGDEATNMTDPNNPDSDNDGLNDGDEAANMSDPNNPDTDGDTIPDGAEVTNGTSPILADTDNDGADDNVDPDPLDPDISSPTVVFSGEVIEFTGPDDLNLDPANAVIAVNSFGETDLVINGVTFLGDSLGGGTVTNGAVTVTTTATNQIADWATPVHGGNTTPEFSGVDQASADNLEIVMTSIRWTPAPDPILVDIAGLTPGALYEIQLLTNEGNDRARQWDISVEGELVVDNYTSEGRELLDVWSPNNSFAYVGEFEAPGDGILNVVMQQHIGGQDQRGADNNPILQGIVVQEAAPATPFRITGIAQDPGTGRWTITWNSSPGGCTP